MIITITNLYPRPDQPTRATFNFQLFQALVEAGTSPASQGYVETSPASQGYAETSPASQGYAETSPASQGYAGTSPASQGYAETSPASQGYAGTSPASQGYAGTSPASQGYAGTRDPDTRFLNLVLVPEWRVWRWPAIRRWQAPGQATDSLPTTDHRSPITSYLPVFYLPLLGRSINWWFGYRALNTLRALLSCRVVGLSREDPSGATLSASATQQPNNPTTESGEPCIVLASWLYPDGVAAARLARDLGLPVWLRVHGTDRYHMKSRWRRRLILDAVDYARGVICNCRAVADDLVRYGIPVDKVHIVPNGVDSTLFRVRDREEVIGYQSSVTGNTCNQETVTNNYPKETTVRTILFVGNLVPIKGPDIMLRAFAALVQARGHRPQTSDIRLNEDVAPRCARTGLGKPIGLQSEVCGLTSDYRLLIIGTGPMRPKLERMARDLGVADRVSFLGSRPHAEVARWMNVADVLCLTSRSEGMPNVVVEALASGLPVVATDVGACRELLADEPEARLCRSEDVEGIAAALADVLSRDVDRVSISSRCAGRYSWRRAAEQMRALMKTP